LGFKTVIAEPKELIRIVKEMSGENQYVVRAFVDVLQEIEVGTKIGDYEFGFAKFEKQHFLQTVVVARNMTEATWKSHAKFGQMLRIFTLFTGKPCNILYINGKQISDKQTTQSFSSTILVPKVVAHKSPFDEEKIEEIRKTANAIENLPKGRSAMVAIRALSYFERGCYLERKWRSESFLNFFKGVELISYDFQKLFDTEVNNQLGNTLLRKLTKEELEAMRTLKRVIQFTCEQLGISDCNVSEIVNLRSEFSAHARLKEVNVTQKEFNNCKELAGKLIISYVDYITPKDNSPA
jgi:hypothetical protein